MGFQVELNYMATGWTTGMAHQLNLTVDGWMEDNTLLTRTYVCD